MMTGRVWIAQSAHDQDEQGDSKSVTCLPSKGVSCHLEISHFL